MDNEIIKQTLIDSFEVLKDSWKTNKESIIRCIVETEAVDGYLAMDMWCYVLKNYQSLLVGNIGNVNFIDNVVIRFNEKFQDNIYPFLLCNTILEHIAPYFVKNNELIKAIFGSLHNAGYSNHSYGSGTEILPALIACLFFQDFPQAIPVIIQSLANNKSMEEIRIGELIIKANTYIDGIQNQWSWKVGEQHISNKVKESLLSCLDFIKNNEDRAEIALSFMAR